jgi:hypothetical protein
VAVNYNDSIGADLTPVIKTPAAGPRRGKGKMPDTELQSLVEGLVSSARQYIRLEVTPKRTLATKYYNREPFGNEQKGRSQFIMAEVHDSVQAVLPAMLRQIFGPEAPVEFTAKRPEVVDQAAQVTDYIRYVFERGDGFLETRNNIMDGLIRRHGIWKWGWDESADVCHERFVGSKDEFAELLANTPGTEPTSVTDNPDGTITAEYTMTYPGGKPWFCTVPPEEFIAVRESRGLRDTIMVGHQTRMTTGELLELGIPESFIKAHGGDDPSLRDDELAMERSPNSGAGADTDAGEANVRHIYVELYAMLDYDGDGVAELRKIIAVGPGFTVVPGDKFNTPADDLPFSVWCPDPEPHSLMGGRSWADRTMDLQRLNSQLMRGMLDSASAAIYTRKWYKEGDANLADLLSTQIGAPIRTRSGGNAVGEFAHSFMGKELLPVLQLTQDIVERRTGQTKGAAQLDASALQSSTQTGVSAVLGAAQAQQEMLCRIYAETSLKPLFKGLLKLFVKYKPQAAVVKLRGQWITVDPVQWDPNMDVTVNVMLGAGMTEEKLQTLFDIATKQEQILEKLGQNNPIVSIKQYRDTLAEMAALRGKKDPSRYFKVITDQQMQAIEQAAANAPPPPNPEMVKVQAQMQLEQMKHQAQVQADQQKAQITAQLEQAKAEIEVQREAREAQQKMVIEQHKAQIEDQRERDKLAADTQLRLLELELKYQVDLSEIQIDAQINREKMALQANVEGAKIDSAERVAAQGNATKEKVATDGNKTKERVATQKPAAGKVGTPGRKPVKRKFSVSRGADGKINGGTIEDSE